MCPQSQRGPSCWDEDGIRSLRLVEKFARETWETILVELLSTMPNVWIDRISASILERVKNGMLLVRESTRGTVLTCMTMLQYQNNIRRNLVPRVFVAYCAGLTKRATLKSSGTRSILVGFKNNTSGRK